LLKRRRVNEAHGINGEQVGKKSHRKVEIRKEKKEFSFKNSFGFEVKLSSILVFLGDLKVNANALLNKANRWTFASLLDIHSSLPPQRVP
jgi:hypothetical protein